MRKKIKKLKLKRIIALFLLVCMIASTSTLAIYKETKTKSFRLTVTKPSYKLRFDNNTGSGSMNDQNIKYGDTVNISSNTFSKTGHKFIGWNTAANGSGTSYTDGQSVSNLSSINGDVITLYAQWQRVMAENVEYHEAEVNCDDVQCMIDELYEMLY